MTYVITSACVDVKDQSCIEVCPVDCIYAEEDDQMCFIHPDECINCAVCVEACPVAAIYVDKDVPSDQEHFTELNARWFTDKDSTRKEIRKISGAGG